jgi:CIC family chloride channel protein
VLAVALATAVATQIGRAFFGTAPSFNVPALATLRADDISLDVMIWFVPCGLAIGLLATLTTRAIYWFEDRFDAMPGNYYTRHVSGMLAVGLILYGFMTLATPLFGQPAHYYVEGVGYAAILDILRGDLTAPVFLLVLAGAKLLVTCLTLGSGASGGIFSPSLFLGAAAGAAIGAILHLFVPGLPVAPGHFALAGMAGMVAGVTGAVMTATIMVFEMTWNYSAIVPVILTATIAYAVRQWLSPPSIYTLKLLRRGDLVPQGLQAWIIGARRARDVMSTAFAVAPAPTVGAVVPKAVSGSAAPATVVVRAPDGSIGGVCVDGAVAPHIVVRPETHLVAVLRAMEDAEVRMAVVASGAGFEPGDVVGVVGDREIAALARSTARLME